MGRRSRKIIPFARNLRKRPPRRIGDSPGKVLCLVVVFTAAFTLGAAELFDTDAILAGWLPGAASPSTSIVGRASVTDGDTLRIRDQRIRLHGIDAPESAQNCRDTAGGDYRCGQQAAMALSDKIGQRTVTCEEKDVDRYGRSVAVCFAGDTDLNEWLVQQGWAVAYRQYSQDYVASEEEARSARRGLWAGSFTQPEEWRRSKR